MTLIQRKDLKLAENPIEDISAKANNPIGARFRENRIKIPSDYNCILKWKDLDGSEHSANVADISKYGCRVSVNKDNFNYPIFTRITRAEITLDSAVVYSGPIIFANEKVDNKSQISIGVTLEGSGSDLDVIAAASSKDIGVQDDLDRILSIARNIEPNFKSLTADLNVLLQEINIKLEKEERYVIESALSENHRKRLEERIINIAISFYRPALELILNQFQDLTRNFDVDAEVIHKQYFRSTFYSLMKGTPFVERGLRKPLGYSGDYGMMVMLYEYIDQGETLFHKFFHRFVCSEPSAVANRNRVGFLSDILIDSYAKAVKNGEKNFKISSLACGPAREIYEFLKHAPLSKECPITVVLVDLEDFALSYAQARLKEIQNTEKNFDLIFIKEDVVVGCIQNKEFLNHLTDSNFIISAGLFDYLTERVSQKMIAKLYDYMAKSGEMLIGNISKKSPDVFAMDYMMDWRLILRDEPDLLRLVSEDIRGKGAIPSVIAEALGLNLFLKVKKTK